MAGRPDGDISKAVAQFESGIMSVDEFDEFVKIAVLARNGRGKTRFGASSPKCLIIDINERGTRSAVGSKSRKREISRYSELVAGYWYLANGKHPYASFCIDTVTNMYQIILNFVLQEEQTRDPSKEKSKPTLPAYGRANKLFEQLLWAYRNLPMHAIFLVQEKEIRDKDGDLVELVPQLPEGARDMLTAAVGITGRLAKPKVRRSQGSVQRIELLETSQTDLCPILKDKTNNLAPITRNPTMPAIIRAWNRSNTDGN